MTHYLRTRRFILVTFINLILLSSCTTIQKSKKNVDYFGVDVNSGRSDRLLPDIKNKNNQGSGVGPFPVATNDSYLTKKSSKNKKVLSLSLGPGINRVLCHIPILKELEVQGQQIHMVTGTGLGAVVASLYASGVTPDKIEWIFYKFSKRVKGVKPYSKEWVSQGVKILLKSLKNKKIQNTKIRLILPFYDVAGKRVKYITRGMIATILEREHLQLNKINQSNSFAPFQKEVFKVERLKSLGADITVGIDVLGNNVDFETTDHYLTGVFGRITGIISKEKELLDFFIGMDPKAMPLDSTSQLPGYLQKCMVKSREEVKKLKQWLEQSIE